MAELLPGQVNSLDAQVSARNTYNPAQESGVIDNTPTVDAPPINNLLFSNIVMSGGAPVNPVKAAMASSVKDADKYTIANPLFNKLEPTERYSNDEIGGYNPYDVNQENYYAENQSWLAQWGNRFGKFATKTLGSFGNSLMDIPNMINAASEGDLSKMWDNPTNNWATDLLEWSEKTMPNYKTNWESEHPFLNLVPFYGNSGNSWGNVLEQVGFTVGAIGGAVVEDLAVGAVTGGVGEIPLAAAQINKAVYKLGKLLGAGEDAMQALKTSIKSADEITKGLKGIDRFNYAARQGLWGANMITSGMSEAAFEGIESYKTLSKDLNQEFFNTNGRLPSYGEAQEIENTAKEAANTRFLLNSALLAATNSIQWGSLMRPFNSTKELLEAEAKSGINVALQEGSKDIFTAIAPKGYLATAKAVMRNPAIEAITGSASEGFEEGAQFVIQNGVDNFYKRKYDEPAINFTNNFMKSFGTAMSKTLGTQEGWENIVYGLLGGAMYKGGEHVYYKAKGVESPNYKKQLDAVVAGLNSQSLTGIFENKYGENVAASAIQTDMQNAAKSGNVFQFQNYKHQQFVNFVLSGIAQNKFDTRLEQLQELKKLNETEFQKTFGIPFTEENRRSVASYVDTMDANAREIQDTQKRVARTFINPFTYRGTGNYNNAEQKATQNKINEQYIAYEGAKDQLVYSMSAAKDSVARIDNLRGQIGSFSSFMSANDVINLSSDEGLKRLKTEYKEQASNLQASIKTGGTTVKTDSKNLKWYEDRLEDIDATLDSKNKDANTRYQALVESVFDRSAEAGDALAGYSAGAVKSKFPRVLMNEMMEMGRDVFYLQKRNEAAINNYAALTTKGGFKKVYDDILEARTLADQKEVVLAPEATPYTTTPPNPLIGTDLIDETTQEDPGVNIGKDGLTADQRRQIAEVTIQLVEGKLKTTGEELEFLDFRNIDDIRTENPNADLTNYHKVKSSDGLNYYIAKVLVDDLRASLGQPITTVAKPAAVVEAAPAVKGVSPLRVEDFINKVFVPQDTKIPFNTAIFSGNKESVRDKTTVTIQALDPTRQAEYDNQKAASSFTPIPNFPGIYASRSPIDISVGFDGAEIGKMAFPDRLLFDVNGKLLTLDQITPKKYAEMTGRTPAQYKQDLDQYKAQLGLKNYLALLYKNNQFKPTTVSASDLKKVMDITITYGELDLVANQSERPLYIELKRNTVSLPTADGKLTDTMVIVSIPKTFVGDVESRDKTEFMNVVYGQNFYNTGANGDAIKNLINSNPMALLSPGTRYVGINQKPDGSFGFVALRPAEMTEGAKSDLFDLIKERASTSAQANFVETTEAEASGKILIGDQEVFYKLPNDAAKSFNDDFNKEVNNAIFIADPKGSVWYSLSVSPIGAVRLEIKEPTSKYYKNIYLGIQKVSAIKSFSEMITALNKEMEKQAAKDPKLAELGLSIASANFRQNIPNDSSIANAEQLASALTAATTPEVYKNGTLRVAPNPSALTTAYKEAGGRTKADVALEEQTNDQGNSAFLQRLDAAATEAVQSVAQPTGGIFGGLTQLNVTNEGDLITPDVSAQEGTLTKKKVDVSNQEDVTQIEYPTVKSALIAVNIGYQQTPTGFEFFDIITKEPIDFAGLTATELAKQMDLKVVAKGRDNKAAFDFRLAENGTEDMDRQMDIQKAKAYIYSILPSYISVQEIDSILDKLASNGMPDAQEYVWGAFQDGVIYLNKEASDIGVEYHEAFHAVFQMLLPQAEQKELLKYAIDKLYVKLKKEGTSITEEIATYPQFGGLNFKQAVDKLAEEYLAEEFRKWKVKRNDAGILQKLFDLIERFFRLFLRSGRDLEALFNNIDTGKYKYSNVTSNSFTQDTTDEYTTPEFSFMLIPGRPGKVKVANREITIARKVDAKTSKQVVQTVASYFTQYRNLPEFRGMSDELVLNQILDDLKNLYSVNNPEYAGWSQDKLNTLAASDKSFIYANEDSRELIKEAAERYINSIRYIEQYKDDAVEDEQQDNGTPSTGFDNTSENNGGFSSLPGLLREYIGFTSYEVNDEFDNKVLREGVPVVASVDAVTVYYGLMRAVANITDPIKFFQRMIRFADGNEQSRHFVDKFVSDTGLNVDALMQEGRLEATKNRALVEIVKKGFNKFRIDYVFTEHDMKKRNAKSYHANRRNVENVQFDKWANTYISAYSNYNEASQKNIRQSINDLREKYFDQRRLFVYTDEQLNIVANEVKIALRGAGVSLSDDYIKYSLLSNKANQYDDANAPYIKEGTQLQFTDPANKWITKQQYDYVQIMKVGEELTLNNAFLEELVKTLAASNNPYFREVTSTTSTDEDTNEAVVTEDVKDTAMVTRLLNVARGNANFDETVGESSYMNSEDKIVYSHQDGTYNIKMSYQLRDSAFRQQLRETGVREELTAYKDNYDKEWLTNNFLLNSPSFEAIADNLLFQRIDGLRSVETNKLGKIITEEFRDQKEGVTYGKYSPREFLVNLMNLYVSYSKVQKVGGKSIVTAPHLIRVLEASKTGDTVNLPINIDLYKAGATDKTLDILQDEVQKEYNRIQSVQSQVGKITDNIVEKYHTGAFAEDGFTVLKDYRGLKFTDNITSLISANTASLLEKKARTNQAMSQEDISQLRNEMAQSLNDMVSATVDVMQREGLINVQNDVFANVLLHSAYVTGNPELNLSPAKNMAQLRNNIGQVIINDYINTLSYNHILHGDSALGLKNDGGIDAVKRAKGDNAAIVSLRTDLTAPELGIDESFTHSSVAIFKEPTSADGTKIADAQMYSTVKALRYTLWGLGRLTPRIAGVLDALENGQDIHEMRNAEGKPYDAVFDESDGILKWDEMTNSLKLVYKDGKSYFKMSVVVLQPNLTSYKNRNGVWVSRPGWETLHNLRVKMESDGVHFAAPESASKMMTLDVSKATDFSDLKGHLFDNSYFGLQTENPSNKKEITTPTQLIQLIDSEQNDDEKVMFEGKEMTIGALKAAYQGYVSQKVNNAYDVAKNELYTIEEFDEDVRKAVQAGKVTPRLAQFQARAIETLESSGSDAQLLDFFSLDDNGNPKYDLNMSATKTKFQQLYLSYFSKGILSQKNPGYTVALMSGIDTKTIRRAKRIENGVVVEWEHVRRDAWDANTGGVQREKILTSPEQVTEVGQYFLDEMRYNVPEYNVDGNITGYYSEMMLPAHYKEFLTLNPGEQIPDAISKGFGVRIPSQDKHSFMSLKIVDFLPANLGSTGMFPKELIALSGADFDIDKEYISRYDFYMTKDARGNISFKKYGDATTDGDKWEEYKMWMAKNNKVLKGLVKDMASQDADYQRLITEGKISADVDLINDIADKYLVDAIKGEYKDIFITKALAQMKLPSTFAEFNEASKTRELNNGVLNNRILDSYTAFLTNPSMQEIAATPASLIALADIQFNGDVQMRDADGNSIASVFGKKNSYPVDTLIGKYFAFRNNTTGKNNIGIDVNANLIYSILNKGGIAYRYDANSEDNKTAPSPFEFDGVSFNTFAGDREFNLNTKQFDGKRTNDILSTLITSATDEAKEQLNALYGLSADALKVVAYMVALKVPLKTAIYMVNQPSIRNYLDIKAVNQNTLKTPAEEKINKRVFREVALDNMEREIVSSAKLSDETIFTNLEQLGLVEVECD